MWAAAAASLEEGGIGLLLVEEEVGAGVEAGGCTKAGHAPFGP